MDGEIDGEDDGEDDGKDDGEDDEEDDDGDDSHPGPSGLGSVSGDINAGFLGEPVGLCSSSFLSDVSVPRSLCPYSPSPSSPSSPLHSPQSVRCLSPIYSPPSPFSVRSRSPVTSTPARGRGHGRGRGRSRSPFPGSTTSAREHGRSRRHGRGRGRGRGRRSPSPPSFPNCTYSLSNPPPFTADPEGPAFSIWRPEECTAYTYFSLFFDDQLLQHIVEQTNLYARQHPFRRASY